MGGSGWWRKNWGEGGSLLIKSSFEARKCKLSWLKLEEVYYMNLSCAALVAEHAEKVGCCIIGIQSSLRFR